MSWKLSGRVPLPHPAMEAAEAGGTWFLRAPRQLSACREGDDAPRWTVSVAEGGSAVGALGVVAVGDHVFTVEDFGPDAPGVVRAFAAADGAEAWRAETAFRPSTRGLAAAGGDVFVHGGGRLLRLDAATGKAKGETDAPDGPGVFAVGDVLWMPSTWGVSRMAADEESPVRVSELPSRSVAGHGDTVFVGGAAGEVVLFDNATGEETSRVTGVPSGPAMRLSPIGTRRVLALGQSGADVVDGKAGAVTASLALAEGAYVAGGAATPHGLAVLAGPLGAPRVATIHDPDTGAVVQTLETGKVLTGNLFHGAGRLVVSAEDLEFFRFDD